MNCQRIQDENLLEAYHDGTLANDASNAPAAADTLAALRAHLETCAACRAQLAALEKISAELTRLRADDEAAAPSERLRANFAAMLASERLRREGLRPAARRGDASPSSLSGRSRIDDFFARLFPRRPVYQFSAALVLLAVGLFIGSRYLAPSAPSAGNTSPQPDAPTLAGVGPAAAQGTNIVASGDDAASRRELAELRAQMENMGRLVTYSLLQQKTTSERLQSVLATLQLKSPDRQLLTDLVGTLALDPSVNVRLSAVEALAPHTNEAVVRAGLLAALPRETAPLVQVAMIELLAAARDTDAAPVFANLSRNETADPTVRETARRALSFLNAPQPSGPSTPATPAPTDAAPAPDNLSHTTTNTLTTA